MEYSDRHLMHFEIRHSVVLCSRFAILSLWIRLDNTLRDFKPKTPPTPTRRKCRVESHRRRRCVGLLGIRVRRVYTVLPVSARKPSPVIIHTVNILLARAISR